MKKLLHLTAMAVALTLGGGSERGFTTADAQHQVAVNLSEIPHVTVDDNGRNTTSATTTCPGTRRTCC